MKEFFSKIPVTIIWNVCNMLKMRQENKAKLEIPCFC